MLAKATTLVASYDSLILVAMAIVGIVTATVWTLTKRSGLAVAKNASATEHQKE